MTVRGIGTDIIEIHRIKNSILKHGDHFLDRICTPTEQAYCNQFSDPSPRFAVRFAAKEAAVKAFGTGFIEGISWLDIEIMNDTYGRPEIALSSKLREAMENPKLLLSMSHCKQYATATVLWISG